MEEHARARLVQVEAEPRPNAKLGLEHLPERAPPSIDRSPSSPSPSPSSRVAANQHTQHQLGDGSPFHVVERVCDAAASRRRLGGGSDSGGRRCTLRRGDAAFSRVVALRVWSSGKQFFFGAARTARVCALPSRNAALWGVLDSSGSSSGSRSSGDG